MKNLFNLYFFTLIIFTVSCTAANSQSRKNKKGERCEEEVSHYRPKYSSIAPDTATSTKQNGNPTAVLPAKDVTKELNAKLDTLAERNSHNKNGQGYRILVYSGRSSDEVKGARSKIYSTLPHADIYTDFKSPNQRVKVGNCADRIEAYDLLGKLKKSFPNAVIIPDQIILKAK